MNEKEAMENLEMIKKMIEETKKTVAYSGDIFILWGVLGLLACLGTYVLVFFRLYQYIFINWVGLMTIGFAYSIYRGVTQEKKEKIITFSTKALGYTWFALGITLMLLGFVAPLAGVYSSYHMIPAIIAIVIGAGCFISAQLYQWKLLTWLSLLWWGAGIGMMFLKTDSSLLVFAFLIILGYLVPGFILQANYKKQKRE
jgi:hypothetical protein